MFTYIKDLPTNSQEHLESLVMEADYMVHSGQWSTSQGDSYLLANNIHYVVVEADLSADFNDTIPF